MRRNLITRMSAASALVAMLVALTFAGALAAVDDMREANRRIAAVEERISTELQRTRPTREELASWITLAGRAREDSDRAATRATTLGIAGIVGSTVLLGLLTTYLARFIVVPVRRTAAAARRLADGDLSARVPEEGDAEPVALARAFNRMAASLQAQQTELEGNNDELAAQRVELEVALRDLEEEKAAVERFSRVGERLASALDVEAVSAIALEELIAAARADAGVLYAVTADDVGRLHRAAVLGQPEEDVPAVLALDGCPAARAVAERRTLTDGRPGSHHEAHVPLKLGDRVLGVVSLGRRGDAGFGLSRLELLEGLADQSAVALSNVVSFRRALRQARINRAVLDATPDPVGLFDLDGRLIVQNEPMATVTAAAAEHQVDGPGDDPDREVRDELLVAGRTYTRYAAPVRDTAGVRMGRVVVLNDVTAERESERMKDEFFALVSHELRTPLTSIIGYLELVLGDEEDLSEDARRFLEVVQRNGRRLLRLVGDMLFVAQVEAGRLSLERAEVDLEAVAGEAVEAARPQAARERVTLTIAAEPVPPLLGDRDRFGQMLDNLVSNALKFTPEGGTVEVLLADAGDRAVLEVRDDGIGIAQAEQDRLFDRFYRSQDATSRAIQGAGLGLTIVKTIVEAHGGTVAVRSAEGVGTTFRVELPYTAGRQGSAVAV